MFLNALFLVVSLFLAMPKTEALLPIASHSFKAKVSPTILKSFLQASSQEDLTAKKWNSPAAEINSQERLQCPSKTSNRRQLLRSFYSHSLALATTSSTSIATTPNLAHAADSSPSSRLDPNAIHGLDQLFTDLPPVPMDCCRIFLCRHGQTENNRLRLVQGSRLDPPINDIGKHQGLRMGLALARADPCPSLLYHSPLKRARQTAEEANKAGNLLSPGESLRKLDSLMEVDFGPVAEGRPVKEAEPGMVATYARWAFGDIDYRPEGGGESGRDVIYRAVGAINSLTRDAASDRCKNRCVAAVTHSTYLRMLLAIFLDESFTQASNMKTVNGCINVLDVNMTGKTRTIGPKSMLVGGFLSRAPQDYFNVEIPVASVLRINENRHLQGLA